MPIHAQALLGKLTDKLGGFQTFLFLAMFVFIIYSSIDTRWIPPSKMLNQTDANNKTVQVLGIYSYAFNDYIATTNDFVVENKQIPRNSFQNGSAILLVMLLVSAILAFRRGTENTLLTREEVHELTKAYLDQQIMLKKITDYTIPESAFLRRYQISEGEKKADYWWQAAEVTSYEGRPEYRLIGWHPYHPARIEADLLTDAEFKSSDVCPSCGKDYLCNQRFIDTTGFSKWKEMFSRGRGGAM